MKLIGYDQTMERGEVAVFLGADGLAYVTASDAAVDIHGLPLGLRQAPIGIELAAAAHCRAHRYHGRYADRGSVSFRPVAKKRRRAQ